MISFLDWNEVPYQQMKHQWTVSMLVFTVSLEKLFEFTRCPQKNESFSSETNLLVKLTVSASTDWNRSLAFHMYSPSYKLISFCYTKIHFKFSLEAGSWLPYWFRQLLHTNMNHETWNMNQKQCSLSANSPQNIKKEILNQNYFIFI